MRMSESCLGKPSPRYTKTASVNPMLTPYPPPSLCQQLQSHHFHREKGKAGIAEHGKYTSRLLGLATLPLNREAWNLKRKQGGDGESMRGALGRYGEMNPFLSSTPQSSQVHPYYESLPRKGNRIWTARARVHKDSAHA